MALYNPKSMGSLTPKVVLAGTVDPHLSMELPILRGKPLAKFFVFVFLGVRVLLVRAHSNPRPFSLHSRDFKPSQRHRGRSQRMWTGDVRQDVLLIKTHTHTHTKITNTPPPRPKLRILRLFLSSFESSCKREDSVQVYNLLHIFLKLFLFAIFSVLFL